MLSLRAMVPSLTILIVTLLAALPWGWPGAGRFVLPLLPFAVVQYWVLRRPDLVPEWLVFATGLTFDVLTNGPLGYWSLIYLSGYAMTVAALPWAGGGHLGRWALFAAMIVILACAEVLLSIAYFNQAIDWWPVAVASAWAVLLYPIVVMILGGLRGAVGEAGAHPHRGTAPARLERGG